MRTKKTNKEHTTLRAKIKKHKHLIPFVIPAILFALIFCYLPMAGIIIAFKDNPNFVRYDVFEALSRSDWTMENFKKIFSDPEILRYIKNTLIISIMKIVILFPLPVVLAVMITELRQKHFSKLVQGLVFLPHFFSWVVIVGIFNSIFGLYGPINNLAEALGGEAIYFMGEPGWFRWLVVILSGWKEIGYSSIVYTPTSVSCPSAPVSVRDAERLQQSLSKTASLNGMWISRKSSRPSSTTASNCKKNGARHGGSAALIPPGHKNEKRSIRRTGWSVFLCSVWDQPELCSGVPRPVFPQSARLKYRQTKIRRNRHTAATRTAGILSVCFFSVMTAAIRR